MLNSSRPLVEHVLNLVKLLLEGCEIVVQMFAFRTSGLGNGSSLFELCFLRVLEVVFSFARARILGGGFIQDS